jgi:hypothetical protein
VSDIRIQIAALEPPILRVKEWEPWVGPLGKLPRNRAEVYEFFGNPGVARAETKWRRDNIVEMRDMPGVPRKWYFQCHRLAEPYMREGLRRASLSCPDYEIERAASFVFRHQRHDVARPLSYHSWGIAIDVDPSGNQARYFAAGKAPEAWSQEWASLWPSGLPAGFVLAMQSVGFCWGADWDEDGTSVDHELIDPMHFELVDRS